MCNIIHGSGSYIWNNYNASFGKDLSVFATAAELFFSASHSAFAQPHSTTPHTASLPKIMNVHDAAPASRNLTCVTHLPAHHTQLYASLCCLCAIDPALLGALVDYYGNATRCRWDYYFRSTVNQFQSLWRLLERQSADNRNPYHLVVALYAAKYRADDSTCTEAEVLARAIAASIVPSVTPPECVGPDGIRVLADGTIHDPESPSESRDVRHLGDIQDNHWKLYGTMRRLCDTRFLVVDKIKLYYGPYGISVWEKGLHESLVAFDSVWDRLITGTRNAKNPWHLAAAWSKVKTALEPLRDKVGRDEIETVGTVIDRLIAAIAPDVKAPQGLLKQ